MRVVFVIFLLWLLVMAARGTESIFHQPTQGRVLCVKSCPPVSP